MTITQKFTTVVVGFAMVAAVAFSFSVPAANAALTESQIQSILSLLQSFGADQSTINNVNASLRGQPTTPSTPSTPSSSCYAFTRDLTVGSTGADVMELQKILNANGYQVAASGAGAPGSESTYFGAKTQAALAKWQAAVGISPAAGYFGPLTRAKLATSCSPSTPGPTVPGSGLSVAAAAQPANALAPQGATRVPFTKFTLTASSNGPVTVSGVVVQRTGLGQNAAFAGVVLVDQDGNQLGTAKSFNSNDQATIGEPVTIPAGQSRTFTVAGNMNSSLASYAGEAPAISVIQVNTSATVSGSLPITGAYHTINATLTVGSLSLDTSSAFAANTSITKEIGTTNQRVSGFRLTAGSAEDVRLKMIRFNQTGSASTVTDLANISIMVGGTAYPAVVSADGKYVTANLGSGILIPEGNNVEVYIQYDIVGSNTNGRTVIFDVDKTTDIYGEGATYGYGISPSTSGGSSVPSTRGSTTETTGTPYLYANAVTISGASVTTIGKANSVPAQNVAVNVSNQPLGGFEVDIKGEAMTVQSMVFTISTSTASTGSGQFTNVTIVDANGKVVAGPVDSTGTDATQRTLTFTDSVTFPVGKHSYTVRGKIPSTATNGAVITLATNPNTGWTNVKGDITGNTISLSQTSFNMNQMTVKSGSLAIARDATFTSKTIVAGGTAIEMARFQLDAQQSGENVRLSSFLSSLAFSGSNSNVLSSCQFYDGATALNTGSNAYNPSDTTSPEADTITFDNPVTVTKGTTKTLSVKCNVSSSASGTFTFDHGTIGSFSVTGVDSSNSITATGPADTAATITVGTGTLVVSNDANSPGYSQVAAGSTDNTIGAFKFTATNEGVSVQRIGLKLTNTASSSPSDLALVSLYDGTTLLGTASFVGSSNFATSTLSTPLTVNANSDKTVTVKANFASIGTGQAIEFSGHFVAIDVDTAGTNTQAVGQSSGTTINATGSTSVSGQRVYKSFPTVALDTLSSTGIADGVLMRFKVTANASGPVSITNFGINIATTTASVTNVTMYGFTDTNYSLPISGVSNDGNLQTTNDCTAGCTSSPNLAIGIQNSSGTATAIQIPAGGTRYFEVRGSVSGATSGASITTKLLGNSSFPSTSAGVSANPLLAAASGSFTATTDMIWSPNSTTTVDRNSQDWTNGFGVSGLPSGGLIKTRSQ